MTLHPRNLFSVYVYLPRSLHNIRYVTGTGEDREATRFNSRRTEQRVLSPRMDDSVFEKQRIDLSPNYLFRSRSGEGLQMMTRVVQDSLLTLFQHDARQRGKGRQHTCSVAWCVLMCRLNCMNPEHVYVLTRN